MSLDATRWAWQQEVSPSEKLVLLSLADRANEVHCCFPSINRLEKDTGLHRQTIISVSKNLEEKGLISIKKTFGKANQFTLIGVQNRHETSTKNRTGTKKHTGTKNHENQYEKPYSHQYEKPHSNLPVNLFNPGKPVDKSTLRLKWAEAKKVIGTR